MGAGTAGGENLIASLRAGDPALVLLGCNDDRFILRRSSADERYLLPAVTARGFIRTLASWIRARAVDLVVPTTDSHVQALAHGGRSVAAKVFLPRRAVIELCGDKLRLGHVLRRRRLRVPESCSVVGRGAIESAFARLSKGGPLWCRPRTGSCARGGAAVTSAAEARNWIGLWERMQGLSPRSFTLSEYLPGREVLCQSVWRKGRMILANTFERLSYFGVDNIPSGVTSLSSLAKTVREPGVVKLCRDAIRAVAPGASGAFSVDTKEDARGRPHITEINAGRFFMAMTAFDRVLRYNMALTYVRLALGEHVVLDEEYDAAEDYYMVRDMDMHPGIYHADDMFEGIETRPGQATMASAGSAPN